MQIKLSDIERLGILQFRKHELDYSIALFLL